MQHDNGCKINKFQNLILKSLLENYYELCTLHFGKSQAGKERGIFTSMV